ncbi:MAG: MFS transporter [Desulfobacterales bacterium]|nr:MFS transporter [Deltaproteobacteria bacterium]NNK96928.1 MFS transporter [Desulfobacterales bacterium]
MDKKGVTISLIITLAVQSIVSMVAVTVPVLAPSAAPDIGISATSAGLYVSIMYIGSMLSSLWSGDFILRFGAIRVSQVSLALTGIGLIVTAFGTIPAMVASALIIGFGYGPVTPASSHILARKAPAGMRSFIFSLKQTGVPIGGVLAGAIVPSLVLAVGWRNGSIIIGAIAMSLIAFIHPLRAEIDADRQLKRPISLQGVTRPLQMVVAHRPLRQLAVISFLYAGMQLCLFTYLVIYLTNDIGLAFVAAGFTLSAAQLAGTIGRIIWGIMADRLVNPRLLLGLLGVGMSAGAIATALISPAWSTTLIVAVLILFGITAIGWNGVYLAEAARLAPAGQVGAATGGTLFFTYLGVVLGPSIFAAVVSGTDSYPLGYVFFAALTLMCGVTAIVSWAKHKKQT